MSRYPVVIEKRTWDGSVSARWAALLARDGVMGYVDLDLDLRLGDGAPAVADLVEFAQRREEMGYPAGLLSRAVIALDDALTRYWHGAWPFDGSLVRLGADDPRGGRGEDETGARS